MQWIEVAVWAPRDSAQAVAALLSEYGQQGVSIEHDGIMPDSWDADEVPPPDKLVVRVYLADDDQLRQQQAQIEAGLRALDLAPVYTRVDEQDWADAWKVHYHTARVGQRLVVRPEWESAQIAPHELEIIMDPGMAFGTGTHPTTVLCLESVEALTQHGLRVLDLGCGSGILSIAAAKLGAVEVLAVDIDPIAVETTTRNAAVNGVGGRITAQQGSLDTVLHSARRFDLLLANILAKVIIPMCEAGLGQVVRPGGRAVFSGLIESQAEDVEAAIRGTGLVPFKRRQQGDWVAIEAYRPDAES